MSLSFMARVCLLPASAYLSPLSSDAGGVEKPHLLGTWEHCPVGCGRAKLPKGMSSICFSGGRMLHGAQRDTAVQRQALHFQMQEEPCRALHAGEPGCCLLGRRFAGSQWKVSPAAAETRCFGLM